jgi:outer membrane protein
MGLSLAGLAAAAVISPAAQAETLADALRQALVANPDLAAIRADLRAQQENIVQARAASGWQVSAGANVGGVFSDPLNGREVLNAPAGLSVGAQLPLYTGGRNAAREEAARRGVDAALERYLATEQATLLRVIDAYSNVRRDIDVLRIRENNIRVLTRQLEATRARFEVGEVTRTDIAQAEARLAGARAALAGAQSTLELSKAAFARVVGQPPGALEAAPAVADLPASLDAAVTRGLEAAPALRAAQAQIAAARAAVRLADAEFRPSASLSLSADGSISDLSDIDLQRSAGLSASARVSVPLFTSGLTRSGARQAREQETAARLRAAAAEQDVTQAVTNAWAGLEAARAVIAASREQVRAAEIALEGARNELEVGSRTTLEVLNQEQELLEARLALANAERDAQVAAYQVLQAMGELSPERLGLVAERVDPARADALIARPFELTDDVTRAFASEPAAIEPAITAEGAR